MSLIAGWWRECLGKRINSSAAEHVRISLNFGTIFVWERCGGVRKRQHSTRNSRT